MRNYLLETPAADDVITGTDAKIMKFLSQPFKKTLIGWAKLL